MIKLDAIEKGYYEVYVNDVKVSQHTKPLKAVSRGQQEKYINQDAYIYIKQPNIEVVVEINEDSSSDEILRLLAELEEKNTTIEEKNTTIEEKNNTIEDMYQEILRLQTLIGGSDVVNVTSVSITPSTVSIVVGNSEQLTQTVLPSNATDKTGVWSSSNESIATVSSSGLVTAVASGTTTITFTTNDGGFTDTTNLTVTAVESVLVKAFPTAVGAGAEITGGRGGTVIHVTNLNDSGAGSFREALESTGTRIIVFDVSGRIDLQSRINLDTSNSNVTIAGQTAPEGGITITGKPIRFGTDPNPTNNVIIRYMRFRNGSFTGVPDVYDHNGLIVQSIDGFILDHCSFSFCDDQAIGMSGRFADLINITVQKCIFSQNATGIIAGLSREFNEGDMTFIYNLFSSQGWRTPNVGGNLQYDIINNVVYNYYVRTTNVNGDVNSGLDLNYVGNYIEESTWGGLGTIVPPTRWQNNGNEPTIYTAFNYHDRYQTTPVLDDQSIWTDFTSNDTTQIAVPSQFFTTTQHPLLGVTYDIMSALEAKDYVIADVGNNKYLNADGSVSGYTDSYDTARINDVINKTAINPVETSYIQPILPNNVRPNDFYVSNSHIPEAWFTANVPSGQTESDIAPNGYTWIENYLNQVDGEIVIPSPVSVESITINESNQSIEVGQTTELTTTFTPPNATDKTGVWSSSNESIATVSSSGVVTSVAEGNAIITFTTNDGGFTDTITLTVTAAPPAPSNLVLNGTLDDATNTNFVTPPWTVSGGVASYDYSILSSIRFDLSNPVVSGTSYNLTFEISNNTGSARMAIALIGTNVETIYGLDSYGTGTHSLTFTFNGVDTDADELRFVGYTTNGSSFDLDNIVLTDLSVPTPIPIPTDGRAFPNALGAGAFARADVNYNIYEVTNLNTIGTGSLWEGMTMDNTIVVFRVSGIIVLDRIDQDDNIPVSNNIVLGQTAPSGGITVISRGLKYGASNSAGDNFGSNIIWRYVRHRLWRGRDYLNPSSADVIESTDSHDIIFDHCSFAFGGDESVSARNDAFNMTIQNSIISYGKSGTLLGNSGDIKNGVEFSVLNNFLHTLGKRAPYFNGNSRFDVIGNNVFNVINLSVRTGGDVQLNYIGNYMKDSSPNHIDVAYSPLVYAENNIAPDYGLTANGEDNTVIFTSRAGQRALLPSDFTNTMFTPLLNYTGDLPDGNTTKLKSDNKDFGANVYLDNNGNPVFELDPVDQRAYDEWDGLFPLFDWTDGTSTNKSNINYKYAEAREWLLDSQPDWGVIQNEHNQTTHTGAVPNSWIIAQGLNPATFNPVGNDLHALYTNIEIYSFRVDNVSSVSASTISLESVSLTPSIIEAQISDTTTPTVTFTPSNATDKTGVWSSNDENIATVTQNGLITAIATGTTTITFTANDGGFNDSVQITISSTPPPSPSSNIILNGTFDNTDNLVFGSSWTIGSGTANYSSSQDSSNLTFTTSEAVSAATYTLDFEIISGATPRFAININGVEVVGSTNYAIGTHSVTFTYGGVDFSGISLRARNASGGTAFEIDNVELTQN